MYQNVKEKLLSAANSDLAKFNTKLCPDTNRKVLGIRIPDLRKMAKDISKQDYKTFLDEAKNEKQEYIEEVIIQGLVIGYANIELDDKLKLITEFVPKIDSWIITDTFCPTIKIKKQELQKAWDFVIPYTKSKKEFEARFGIIMLLDYFIIPEYVDKVIEVIDKIENKNYYTQMAMAWTMAEIGIKFNDKLIAYLKGKNNLDKFTYNKTLQKMIESYRISDKQKTELKTMKRK